MGSAVCCTRSRAPRPESDEFRKDKYRNNADWVHRMNEVFTHVDVGKKGYITLEDWELWVDNIEREVNPDPRLVDKLRKSLKEYCGEGGIGLTPGKKATREEFVNDMMPKFVVAEGDRKIRMEALLFQLNNDWYDIVDTTKDDMVTLDGYRKILKACNFDESVADDTFKVLDKENVGKIERSKLLETEFHFWFTLGHEESKGLFGANFELRPEDEFRKNADWVHRMNEVFTQVDISKKGYITIEDWELWADNIERDVSPDPKLVAKLRKSLREYCGEGGIGLTPGKKATREEFVNDMMPKFAVAEGNRKTRMEALLYQLNNDWYDIVDTTKDDMVTLDGYRKIMRACNFDESVADDTFKVLDKEKVGKIERSKLIEIEFQFWFTLGHEESKGLFGDTFELPK